MYQKLLRRRLSLVGTLNVGCHVMLFLARCIKVSLQNLQAETWRQLLLATQKYEGCSVTRHKTMITKKVCVAEFRLEVSNNVLGINYLPIVSNKSALGMKIILSCHYSKVSGFNDIHASTNLAITRMQRGKFGVFMPNSHHALDQYSWTCKGCLQQRDLLYMSTLGPVYTKLSAQRPFSKLSIDPLMPIDVIP